RDHQMQHEKKVVLECHDDPLAEAAKLDHPLPLRGGDRHIDRAEEERALEPHLLERLVQNAGAKMPDVEGGIRIFGQGGAAAPPTWPSKNQSGEHFGELDQIAERVGEEREPAADGGQDEGLGDDPDAARAKLADRLVDAHDVEAEMVVAAIFQAVAEV